MRIMIGVVALMVASVLSITMMSTSSATGSDRLATTVNATP